MKRGAVYLAAQDVGSPRPRSESHAAQRAHLEERSILRPVVLVSRDAINRYSAVVLICPLVEAASVQKLYPSDVQVHAPEGGLSADGVVLTGQLRALARAQLVRYLGELSAEVMREIDQALRITLDLE
ncbi:MAG TPA: type II toxin-antitoxin system PemK/MazF family toxin [Chloroflexota bacterium]|nr:type II toxin-antitoxin system PemK/MazF family toxin [Chloroflexota bacterium]